MGVKVHESNGRRTGSGTHTLTLSREKRKQHALIWEAICDQVKKQERREHEPIVEHKASAL
jgi:hypothetical protein